METLILRYELKGKARTRPDFFRVVLGPCAQFYPCEASEKKWGQTPKSKPKEIKPILGLKLANLATFFKISTSNLLCPSFTFRLIIYRQTKLANQIWAQLHRRHRWAVGVDGPFKSSVTGPDLLDNCYLENEFKKKKQCEPP